MWKLSHVIDQETSVKTKYSSLMASSMVRNRGIETRERRKEES